MTSSTIEQVIRLVKETLGLSEEEPVNPGDLLFYDLDFTSLDLLDLLFRLEEHFDVAIPEGTLYGLARGDLTEDAFCRDEVLTEQGREQLVELLHDTPESMFPQEIHSRTLPRYCTVAAFARLVDHERKQPRE